MNERKKVLVTGGAGYIGSHTVVALHRAGYIPIILDDFSHSDPYVLKALKSLLEYDPIYYRENCRNEQALEKIGREHPDLAGVIHFAAFKSVGESVEQPILYYENNLESTTRLLRFCLKFNVLPFVFSSSCTVYGQPEILPVTEEAPIKHAESPYGRTKQIGEYMLSDAIKAGELLKVISLRYFNPIGAEPSGMIGELPIGRPNNLVPYITQTAAGIRDKLTIFGKDYDTPDGTCIRDYIHVMDLALAHVKALEYIWRLPHGTGYMDYFNIGAGQGYSVLEIVNAFQAVTGVDVPHQFGERRHGDITKIWANPGKANKKLGWKADMSIEQALGDAWAWQQTLTNLKLEVTA